MSRPDDVVITGAGALTSVGNDAIQTAAAVRAGIVRFATWEPAGGGDAGDMGVVAAALPFDLGDVAWVEKAAAMAEHPIHEALWQAELFDFADVRRTQPRAQVAAYVVAPYPDRPGVSAEAYRLFAVEAQRHCIAPAHADRVQIIPAEHAAGGLAVARAAADLRAGEVDFAVVGGLDSLLHTDCLSALRGDGRLKSEDTPSGLIPGEAAAAVVLERGPDARRRGAHVLGVVGEVVADSEPSPYRADAPIEGRALSRAVARALELGGGPGRIHRVMTDLNGERWRSLEWALVETRALGKLPAGWELLHPADCTGDVGAATGILHLVLTLRAFAREYAGPDGVLLTATAAHGERVAMTVFPPQGPH